MTTPVQDFKDHSRDLMRLMAELVTPFGGQIAGWLVLGNAGGLVLAFNGILGGSTCDLGMLTRIVLPLVLGLFLAFVGALTAYAGTVAATMVVARLNVHAEAMASAEHYIKELAEEGIEVGDQEPLSVQFNEAGQAVGRIKQWPMWALAAISAALFLGSMACFAYAVTVPLMSGPAAFASCSSRP